MDNQDNFKQNNYYVLVFDSIWENPLSSKPAYLAVFLYVLTHAYKRDKEFIFNNEKIVVKRGQWLGSMRKIAEHFGLSISSVQKICKYLKSEHIIEHQANTKFTLFTVLNYDRYQPKLNTEVNTKRTPRETKDKDNKDNIKEKENIIKEKESLYNSLGYLVNEEELRRDYLNKVFSKYNVSFTEVKRKAEELYNYCQAKGKRYKNYQRFLINALIRDFGYKFNQ